MKMNLICYGIPRLRNNRWLNQQFTQGKYLIGILVALLVVMNAPIAAQPAQTEQWFKLDTTPVRNLNFVNLRYEKIRQPRIALVLSGGGARGIAHIGVLQAFEDHNIPVDLIVGTSIGSIVGGFYASGFSSDEILQQIKSIDWGSIFTDQTERPMLFVSQKSIPRRHLIQFRMDGILPAIPSSVSQGQKIFQTLYNKLLKASYQNTRFDRLRVPFRAVATDIVSGEKVVLASGDLAETINASMAFPLLFAPVEIDGRILADGGITDNLPVQVALQDSADIVIAVDCTSELRKREEIKAPWEIADQVTSIMMKEPTERSRKLADILIKPDLHRYKGGDFEFADSLVAIGYRAAIAKIDSIKKIIARASNRDDSTMAVTYPVDEIKYEGFTPALQNLLKDLMVLPDGKNIQIAGIGKFYTSALTNTANTKLMLTASQIYENMRMIYGSGYLQDIRAQYQQSNGIAQLTFHVSPQPFIKTVYFSPHPLIADSVADYFRNEYAGKVLNIQKLSQNLESLRNNLYAHGYSLVDFQLIAYLPQDSSLHITLKSGKIDSLEIVGNNVTRDFVILREFPLSEGDIFQNQLAAKGIENIYGTDLFDRVQVNLREENGTNILRIKVKEKRYYVLRLGAHYSTERLTEGFMEILADNFLGSHTKMSLFGSVGEFTKNAELRFYTVRLFRTYLTASFSTYYNERSDRFYRNFRRLADYQIIRRGMRFSLGQQIQRLGLISFELRSEEIDLGAPNDKFSRTNFRLRSISVNSVVDKRDKLPFPEKGIYNRWSWEAGSKTLLGGSEPFTKIYLALEGYYPLHRLWNYHPFLEAGTADLTLPFTEYFFIGGQQSIPGLHERELFGRQFVHAGVDLRYRVNWKYPIEAYLIGSYNFAAIWERPDEPLSSGTAVNSIALSAAINSLIGPIRLTYSRIFERDNILQFTLGFDF